MNAALDKKLKKAITTIESRGGANSPRRSRDGFTEALNSIKKVFVEEGYWSKTYGSRSVSCLFSGLEADDASLRLLADQCLQAVFRKLILKSQCSRVLAILINEISRNGNSTRVAAAMSMLLNALRYGREQKMQVYAMHFLHSLREALRRPEQTVQLSIENFAGNLIRFFRYDYIDAHESYANRLMLQCLENLVLVGAPNRACSSVLASLAENFPGTMTLLCGRLLGLFSIVEEAKHKTEIVGILNTLRKMWPSFICTQPRSSVRLMLIKVLACLKSSSSVCLLRDSVPPCSFQTLVLIFETAVLELLCVVVVETPYSVLNFQPLLFKLEADFSEENERKSSYRFSEMDPLTDLNESLLSRSTSISSLVESEPNTSRSTSTVGNASDEEEVSNKSGESTPTNRQNCQDRLFYIEMDPLFQSDSPVNDYLLDKQFEEEEASTEIPPTKQTEICEGLLCAQLPPSCCPPNADFFLYSSTLIAEKFLLAGRMGELKSDSEIRTSLKILALKYLALVGSTYQHLTDVTVPAEKNSRQSLSDLHQLLSSSDEGLCIVAFSLFVNLESTYYRSGRKLPQAFYTAGRFISMTATLMRNASPRRLKEVLQVLSSNIELVMSDDRLFTTVCDSALASIECDFFLLKIARAEFISKIRWNRLSPHLVSAYQRLCLTSFCLQFFDNDYRVVKATMDNFPSLVSNAEFGFISDIFHLHWNESVYLPNFTPFGQVFAMHPHYSFKGDSPDLALEENLSEALEILANEYAKKPGERTAGYINALLMLACSYPPALFSGAWDCLNRSHQNHPHPLLTLLIEIAESSTTTLSQLVHVLKLIGLLFAGIVESAFVHDANRADVNQNLVGSKGQQMLDRIVLVYLRIMNLYYTIIKESASPSKASSVALPLFTRITWTSSTRENSPSYSLSNLVGTGIRPYHSKTSFLNSPSLVSLESVIRGSFSNFMSSMKSDVEERVVAPLESALDGFCCLLEALSRDSLSVFIDELFLYTRAMTNLAIRPVANLLTQMLKVIFGQNASNINANVVVLLKSKHLIPPTDHLEMLIGRTINNYSVHVAFLDRFEQMDLHRLRHLGWANKSVVGPRRGPKEDIVPYLEQFEASVAHLLHSYLNIVDAETRCSILRLICILALNDVRYDKLDPNNRVLNSVLTSVNHERLKNGNHLDVLFIFLCVVSRSVESLSFDAITEMVCKCAGRTEGEADVENVLDAIHIVLIEAISFHGKIPKKLIEILSFPDKRLFEKSPARVVELWTSILHWSRSTKSDLLWQETSASFVDSLLAFVEMSDSFTCSYKTRLDLAHALSVAMKISNPTVFRPVNQLFSTFLDVSKRDLFLSIPFALMLLCRLDHEDVLRQLIEIDSSALEMVGRSLANLFLHETSSLFNVTERGDLDSLEDGIAFLGIMLVHVLRSETVNPDNPLSIIITREFRSTILDSDDYFKNELVPISHLYPKVYSAWILLLFQLEIFEEPSKTLFSPNLPHFAKQLVSLLFLQRLCEKRLSINEAVISLLNTAPDDFIVRTLKVSKRKQLETLRTRLPTESLNIFVEKARSYLAVHSSLTGVFDSIAELGKEIVKQDDLVGHFSGVESWILNCDVKVASEAVKTIPPSNFSEICSYLIEMASNSNDVMCSASLAVHLDIKKLKDLIESMTPSWRPVFLRFLFESLNKEIRSVNNQAYLVGQQPNFIPLVDICRTIGELLDTSPHLNSVDCRQILLGFRGLPRQLDCFDHIHLKSMDKILNMGFIRELMEAETGNTEIESSFYEALAELFKRGRLSSHFSSDYDTIDQLCLVLKLILDKIESDLPKTQRFKINRNHWNVDLIAECSEAERLKDEILESFILVQRTAHLFLNSSLLDGAKRALLSILRLPVFSRMFLVPRIALNRDWKLDIFGQKEEIKVTLIPIHMLSDPEIISDFAQRILCLGWTSKTQFEMWFVTLLGVLCSTSIGDGLEDRDVQKLSVALDALTNMLLLSTLSPKPGDTVDSHYLIKHRQNKDGYPFLHSTNGKHAAVGRTQIEQGYEPQSVYSKNSESFSQHHFYSFGQTSTQHLWSATVEEGGSPTTEEPDVFSSLKALFENYFHWFKSDMPLPILMATVRSISMLSDMFKDTSLYSYVYTEMKSIMDKRSTTDHPLYGYVLYTLFKCLSVMNLDKRGNTSHVVDGYVQAGLSSKSSFVVFGTLHGLLYLIQSNNPESFRSSYVFSFVLEEIQRLSVRSDILSVGDSEPIGYYRLLFTVAFQMVEHSSIDQTLINRFTSTVRGLFIDPRLSGWQRSLLSNGIQALIIHNPYYCEWSREVAVELFDTYQLRPLHLPYALSVYVSYVYRATQDEKPLEAKQIISFQSDLHRLLNVFSFYTVPKYIHSFLPAIARLMFTLLDKEQLFEMLLSTIPMGVKTSGPFKLADYDRSMLYLLYYVLRDACAYQQQEIIAFSLKSIFPKLVVNEQSSLLTVYTNILIMCALSDNRQVNSLVHVLLRQSQHDLSLLRACYSESRESFKKSAEMCGSEINQRDFPMELKVETDNDYL